MPREQEEGPLDAPFAYFGGKRRAAPIIWQALGDVGGYIEPFCGSAAVLLRRPPFRGRRVETLNDADGWLVNMWRAIQLSPATVASHAWGPMSEIDYHARLAWLQQRHGPELVAWLEGDPEHHDAKAAGWWLSVTSSAIGSPFDPGPWHIVDGRLRKTAPSPTGIYRELPSLGDAGGGIYRTSGTGRHEADLAAWFARLQRRLERVRITCGDWRRVLTPSPLRAQFGGDGATGVFLDPPYSTGDARYAHDSTTVADEVREWCMTAPRDLRIVLAGYAGEHDELLAHGWTVTEGKSGSGDGYSRTPGGGHRERLWRSPACHPPPQAGLFELDEICPHRPGQERKGGRDERAPRAATR